MGVACLAHPQAPTAPAQVVDTTRAKSILSAESTMNMNGHLVDDPDPLAGCAPDGAADEVSPDAPGAGPDGPVAGPDGPVVLLPDLGVPTSECVIFIIPIKVTEAKVSW